MPGIRELQKLAETFQPGDARREKIEKQIERKRHKRDTPSPTKLTKDKLVEMGVTFDVVEQRFPHSFITKDFLSCIDIIACSPALGIVGIQATSNEGGDHHKNRERKIAAEPRALVWMRSGGAIEVWSWRLAGAAGTEKLWTLRRSRAYRSTADGAIVWQEIEEA
jgi:hypothetical protein